MSNIQEWIDDSRARADRAADHVASVAAGVERWTMKVPPADTDTDIMLIGLLDGTLGQALDALQAVLDLHTPVDVEPSETICNVCSNRLPNGRFMPTVEYPCPTVQAIQNALGAES